MFPCLDISTTPDKLVPTQSSDEESSSDKSSCCYNNVFLKCFHRNNTSSLIKHKPFLMLSPCMCGPMLVYYRPFLLIHSCIYNEDSTFLDASRVWVFDNIFLLNIIQVYIPCKILDKIVLVSTWFRRVYDPKN